MILPGRGIGASQVTELAAISVSMRPAAASASAFSSGHRAINSIMSPGRPAREIGAIRPSGATAPNSGAPPGAWKVMRRMCSSPRLAGRRIRLARGRSVKARRSWSLRPIRDGIGGQAYDIGGT